MVAGLASFDGLAAQAARAAMGDPRAIIRPVSPNLHGFRGESPGRPSRGSLGRSRSCSGTCSTTGPAAASPSTIRSGLRLAHLDGRLGRGGIVALVSSTSELGLRLDVGRDDALARAESVIRE